MNFIQKQIKPVYFYLHLRIPSVSSIEQIAFIPVNNTELLFFMPSCVCSDVKQTTFKVTLTEYVGKSLQCIFTIPAISFISCVIYGSLKCKKRTATRHFYMK